MSNIDLNYNCPLAKHVNFAFDAEPDDLKRMTNEELGEYIRLTLLPQLSSTSAGYGLLRELSNRLCRRATADERARDIVHDWDALLVCLAAKKAK